MNICLYILNTMADWEISWLLAEINSRRYFRDQQQEIGITRVAATMAPVTTMGGLNIEPDLAVADLQLSAEDLLLLPGADSWAAPEHQDIIRLAAARVEQGGRVAAICGATVALAQAGVLNDVHHTSNDCGLLNMICPAYTGEALYQQKPAVHDGNLITASGLAPVEFSYEVLKMLGVFRTATLEAWRNLYLKKDPELFTVLMNTL